MISNISHKLLYISLVLLVAGTLGGWAIIEKLNGYRNDYGFLYAGAAVTVTIFCVQCGMYFYMRERIFLGLILLMTLGLSLAWFMSALFIPLLWVDIVGWEAKLVLLLVLFALIWGNVAEAFRVFGQKWEELKETERARILARKGNFLNWDGLISLMKFSPDLHIPGLSKKISTFLSVAMVFSMIAGFGLRNIYPVASVFAVGIPSALVISLFAQQIGFNMAQARKVRELECEYKVVFFQRPHVDRLRKKVRKKIG